MTGNCLDDHLGNGVVIENTYGSVVSGNMIEECQGTAIILDRDCYGITLAANVIAHEFTDGIDLRDAHGCAVSANTFTIVKRHALVDRPGERADHRHGEQLLRQHDRPEQRAPKASDRQAGGLVLNGTRDIAVVGNVFAGVGPRPIAVEGKTTRVNVTANVFQDVESDHNSLADSVIGDNIGP